MPKKKKDIIITTGDPAGCGPQITYKAIKSLINNKVKFWVVGDKSIAKQFSEYYKFKDEINFVDIGTKRIANLKKGVISKLAGRASLNYLEKALELIKKNRFSYLVTAPISKEAVSLVSPGFSGHTEFLGDHFNSSKIAMMMASSRLRVVLLTRHTRLKDVSALIRKKLILDTLSLTYSFLNQKMKIKKPAIAMASLNPHAGVDTFLASEEKVIRKALLEFKRKAYGPYPSDSLFNIATLKKFDCIITPYHDQAMIPFKLLSFRSGVNITLGLPIIRTSPDHGVAFNLVKNNPENIFYTSMQAAIIQAASLEP